ncbi:MAG TPA: hypothetical protein VI078_06880 [bacterium]
MKTRPATVPPPAQPWRTLRTTAIAAAWVAASVLLFAAGLRVVDWAVGRDARISVALGAPGTTIRTLELFPYDGFHVQANTRHRGPMPWEPQNPDADYDIRTGDKGYFIDFSLEDPPPKGPEEFRIVVVGGSGAQGWGATRNERTFAAVLERALNRTLAAQAVRVRVINLAMGGSSIYQNFVALNQWGHALEPDLILAYIGRNEFYVPLAHEEGTDAFFGFTDLDAFSLAMRGDEYPPGMAWLVRLMPNTMRRTSIGLGIKLAWGWEHFRARAEQSYKAARGQRTDTIRQVVADNVIPRIVHSLRSIKRDFDGVPIVVAWQAARDEVKAGDAAMGPGFYNVMYNRIEREVVGFMNERWMFVNVHRLSASMPNGPFGTHLDDAGHEAVGTFLAGRIGTVMPDLLEERRRRVALGLPAGYGRP